MFRLLILLAVFFVGMAVTFPHAATTVPGNLIDSRFNMYVLEHGYRWLTGKDAGFWNAPFYYPAPRVIAFSDCHAGTLPIYAAWRAIGLDREHAFSLWTYTLFLLTFFAGYWGLRRLGAGFAGALIGSYFFAFALPISAEVGFGHAQLLPRFWIPIAFVYFLRFLEKKELRDLSLTIAAVVLQFYATIYIGYFLVLALVTLGGLSLFIGWRTETPAPMNVQTVVALGVGALCLAPLFIPYIEAIHHLAPRNLGEWDHSIPQFSSYFQAPPWSLLWAKVFTFAEKNHVLVVRRHLLFAGVVPWAALCYGAARGWWREKTQGRGPLLAGCLAALFFLTLRVHGFSLYGMLTTGWPGVEAIRFVTRVILVMAFPLAVLIAYAVEDLMDRIKDPSPRAAYALLLGAILVIDQAAPPQAIPYKTVYQRVTPYTRLLEADHHRHTIFGLVPDTALTGVSVLQPPNNSGWVQSLDVMLATQSANYATLNGYSGNYPRNYPVELAWGIEHPAEHPEAAARGIGQWIDQFPLAFSSNNLLLAPGLPFPTPKQ